VVVLSGGRISRLSNSDFYCHLSRQTTFARKALSCLPLLALPIFKNFHHTANFPEPIRPASGHRWRNAQRLMDANEVVVHREQRNGERVALQTDRLPGPPTGHCSPLTELLRSPRSVVSSTPDHQSVNQNAAPPAAPTQAHTFRISMKRSGPVSTGDHAPGRDATNCA